jgi:hypothetical protein
MPCTVTTPLAALPAVPVPLTVHPPDCVTACVPTVTVPVIGMPVPAMNRSLAEIDPVALAASAFAPNGSDGTAFTFTNSPLVVSPRIRSQVVPLKK